MGDEKAEENAYSRYQENAQEPKGVNKMACACNKTIHDLRGHTWKGVRGAAARVMAKEWPESVTLLTAVERHVPEKA